MAIVTEIRRKAHKNEIFLDGKLFAKVDDSILKSLNIALDDDVDEDELGDTLAAKTFANGYESALTYLEMSAHTQREVQVSLYKKGYCVRAVDAILERLIGAGLIGDAEYAERSVEMRMGKQKGRMAIFADLTKKGVSREEAKAAIAHIDDEAEIAAATEFARNMLSRDCEDKYAQKRKCAASLARKGFTWGIISEAMSRAGEDVEYIDD